MRWSPNSLHARSATVASFSPYSLINTPLQLKVPLNKGRPCRSLQRRIDLLHIIVIVEGIEEVHDVFAGLVVEFGKGLR